MQKLFQLSSKELNPALTIHLQANEYTICPLWRQLGKCKYLNLPKSPKKKGYVEIVMESQEMLYSCASQPQARGLHAPVRTSYFLLCTCFITHVKFCVLLLFSYMSVGADIYYFVPSVPFVEI